MGFLPSTVYLRTEAFLFLGFFAVKVILDPNLTRIALPQPPPMAFRKTWHASFTGAPVKETILSRCFFHLSQTGTTIFSRKKWVRDPKYPILLWVEWCFSTPTSMLRLSPSMVAFPHGSTSFVRFSRAKCEFWLVLQVYANMRNHVTFQITIFTYMICYMIR